MAQQTKPHRRARRASSRAGTRTAQGDKTRREILDVAADIASVEGLEGVTIGRLAQELGMSKSGLFGHFGAKEDLQLAVVDRAKDIFVREVADPAMKAAPGLRRVVAMIDHWLGYVERRVFRGGCFFMAAALEFDGRSGPVRRRIAELSRSWRDALRDEIRRAQAAGDIARHVDADQLAFEVHALAQEANWAHELLGEKDAFARARRGVRVHLRSVSTARRRNHRA